MKTRNDIFKVTVLGLAALALTFGVAWASPIEGDDETHEIHVERKVICDGDDCSHESGGHKVIFVGEDGKRQVIEGDGDHTWISAEGANVMKMRMHGMHQKGGFLGVGLTELTPELRAHFGVPENSGVMVSKIVDDSAAQKAGIEVGDIITLVDAEEVASGGALSHAIGGYEGGESVTLEIWRDGAMQKMTATLEEREGMKMAMKPRIHINRVGAGDGERIEKRIMIHCDSDDEECGAGGAGEYDCGGAEECRVEVQCNDGGCSCTVNGEDADCADIPGVPHHE